MKKIDRIQLAEMIRERYQSSRKKEQTKILDEFVAITGLHRKSAVRLLSSSEMSEMLSSKPNSRQIYDDAVKETLIVLWEASDRICGKRLKAIIPVLLESLEGHQRLKLDATVRERVLSISAATIDRLLRSVRSPASPPKRKRPVYRTRAQVAVKTFADWSDSAPGHLGMDFVAHCGGSLTGPFIHSLVVTDVSSGWTEATALLMREQSIVVEGLDR